MRTPRTHLPILLGVGLPLLLASATTLFSEEFLVPEEVPTIQGAIDLAVDGDEIVVSPGTYFETLSFQGKAIVVRSLEGRDSTTIDATGAFLDIVYFGSGEGPDSILQGLTLTRSDGPYPFFGAVNTIGTSPTIEECRFVGFSLYALVIATGSPTVRDCEFVDNQCDGAPVVLLSNATPVFVDCQFVENGSSYDGGVVSVQGSGSSTFVNCRFHGNDAVLGGGALNVAEAAQVSLVNCVLSSNSALLGGALKLSDSSSVNLIQTTFVDNLAAMGGDLNTSGSAVATVVNSVLWGNAVGGIVSSSPSSVAISFSNVEGGFPGNGNLDADPEFVDPLGPDGEPNTGDEDYSLLATSPCVDGGDTAQLPADVADVDEDGNTTESLPVDLAGTARVIGSDVDMGAFESTGALPFIRGDADGSGSFSGLVDGLFLLNFQFVPGSASPPCLEAADADNSGFVSGLVDGYYLLSFQFVAGSPPPPTPYPFCGLDDDGTLGCDESTCP